MIYLTYARGFKSGGYNYPAATSQVLAPEILDMVELGLKIQSPGNRVQLNAALYSYDYADLQVTRAPRDGSAGAITDNAADAEILGVDIDLKWLATDRTQITAGLNILETEYKDYDANAKVFNSTLTGNPFLPGMSDVLFDASGESMLRAPDWSAFLSLQHDFSVGDGLIPVVVTYSYKDKYNFDFIADPLSKKLQQDGYGILNAKISYITPGESWKISVWGNNLTDEKYFDDLVANVAGIRGSWGAPRTYGIDVKFNF